jgi:uncharacterized protein
MKMTLLQLLLLAVTLGAAHAFAAQDDRADPEPLRALMLRGTEWAATGVVTLPAPRALPVRRAQAVVVTGGHGFDEEEFPNLFESDERALYEFAHQEDDSEIFEEIEDWPFDVVVLYNMSQRISEKRRANLVKLLEGGVGIVALHHSIAAYQAWPEFERIIGAKYYLEETTIDGVTHPKSTFKHDIDFTLHIEDATHPITQGLQDFVVHDETYNGMTFDPENHVLITTDHPTSARPIGWARRYANANVCFIQVGHGPQVFTDPNFQRLVRQAVEWAARGHEE